MAMKRALKIVLGIGLFGVAFSGMLSYQELFRGAAETCPAPGAPGTVFGYPACVYGFFMYLGVAAVAAWGLLSGRRTREAIGPELHRTEPIGHAPSESERERAGKYADVTDWPGD